MAAVVGGVFGFAQFLLLVFLDASREDSMLPKGGINYVVFAVTWIARC